MSKKSCCCGAGTHIAIPCRNAITRTFIGKDYYYGPPPFGGGQGQPERVKLNYVFRSNGANTELLGPFRYVSGVAQFDTSRDIKFMMRGAGGGAAGPWIGGPIDKQYGKGGNGAYTQYQAKANPNHAGMGGEGGRGGTLNNDFYLNDPYLKPNYKSGGPSLIIDGDGGDASVIGIGLGSFIDILDYKAAAGAGGGAAIIATSIDYPPQVLGPRDGGDAGITQAKDGQDGYSRLFSDPLTFDPTKVKGKGYGATDLRGGSAGGTLNIPPPANEARDGTVDFGGAARTQRREVNNQDILAGLGGGGGGGWFGGGGGSLEGSGGGGSSKGETLYSFISNELYPANYCNPYLLQDTGMGGKKLPRNSSENGQPGTLVAYWIYAECACDPTKNSLPEPLFICLSQAQVDQIQSQLLSIPQPEGGFWTSCTGLFTIEGEEYYLLGQCDQQCEEVYNYSDKTITSVRWGCTRVEPSTGTPIDNGPPCCQQIVCRPFCRIQGADCANCGCAESATAYVCCNNPNGITLPFYTAVYNGWIYNCTVGHQGWQIPGQGSQYETLCLSPVEGITCDNAPPPCNEVISEPFTGCIPDVPCNCPPVNASVTITSQYFQPCGGIDAPGGGGCQDQGVGSFTETFDNILCYSGPEFKYQLAPECFPNVLPAIIGWQVPGLSFITSRVVEELALTISFDCIPPVDSFGNYPYSIPSGGNGVWSICGASVEVDPIEGAYLTTIVNKLNNKLAGRVTLSVSADKVHTFGNFPDKIYSRIENIVSGDRLVVNVYINHTYYIGCGSARAFISAIPCIQPFPCRANGERFFQTPEQDGWDAISISVSDCTCITLTPPDPDTANGGTSITPCCNEPGIEVASPCCDSLITITLS